MRRALRELTVLSVLSVFVFGLLSCGMTDYDDPECQDCFFRVTINDREYDISDPAEYSSRVQTYIDASGRDHYGISVALEGHMHHYEMGLGIAGITSEIGLPGLNVDSDASDHRAITVTEHIQGQIVSVFVVDPAYNNRLSTRYTDSENRVIEGEFEARYTKLHAIIPEWSTLPDTFLVSSGRFKVRLEPRCPPYAC